jgi:hypothetical protein
MVRAREGRWSSSAIGPSPQAVAPTALEVHVIAGTGVECPPGVVDKRSEAVVDDRILGLRGASTGRVQTYCGRQ